MLSNVHLFPKLEDWTRWNVNVVCLSKREKDIKKKKKKGEKGFFIRRVFFYLHKHVGFFQTQLQKSEIQTRPLTTAAYRSRARSAQEVDDLEETLKEYEGRVSQMNDSYESLQRRYLQLTELRHVLRESSGFFEQVLFICI
jgi:hypothetical protein